MGTCLSTQSPARAAKRWTPQRTKGKRTKSNGTAAAGGEEMTEEELSQVPRRMVANGSSHVACLHTQQGKKGTNQDAMIVWEDFNLRNDTIFCGVFDGHGPYGHFVARKVRNSLPLKLMSQWRSIDTNPNNSPKLNGSLSGSTNSEENGSIFDVEDELSDGEEKIPEIFIPLKKAFIKACKLMDKELKLHPTVDCFCSGTTAVTLVKQGQDLVIGNVGDSRAILGTRDEENHLIAVQLTVDLKPNLPREAARIQRCRGRVFALQDEPDVARVWLPNNDSPGLAMARAFGDFCLKDYGLISVPDFSYRRLMEKDEFVILATDGVWDVLSNKEAVDIVTSAPSRATSARALIDCAVRSWRLKFPTSKIDDCAAVCLFFDFPEENEETEISVSKFEGLNKTLCENDENHEIVPIMEGNLDGNNNKGNERGRSVKSLAECISMNEEEEWSALEGVTRVNSLLSIPRFLSWDKRSTSQRK